jgi:hypothetical protein
VDAYLQYNRIEATDDHGRNPMLTSRFGGAAKSSLRDSLYRASRPCKYTGECPVVGDRMNVSLDVLEKHYDRRSEEEKAEQRRGYLDEI